MTDTLDTLQQRLIDSGISALIVTDEGFGVINKSRMSPALLTMVAVLNEPELITSPDEIELMYDLAKDHFSRKAQVVQVSDETLEYVDEVVNAQHRPAIAIVQSSIEDVVMSFNIKYSIRDNAHGDHTALRFIRHFVNDFGLNVPNFIEKCRQVSNTIVH